MDQVELTQLLDGLIATWENEVVEFKQANDNFSTDDIGKYFSALANEANLLTNLRRKGRIRNTGSRGQPVWKLAE